MKYLKSLTVASLALGAVLVPAVSVIGNASAAVSYLTARVLPGTTFKCIEMCSLPGVLNVDPGRVVGPYETEPELRIARWERTVYIWCVFDATGDGLKYYRAYIDDRDWTGEWWFSKADLKSPAPGVMDDSPLPICPPPSKEDPDSR